MSEAELSAALERAILRAVAEVLPRGDAIPAEAYADLLVGLYLDAARPETPAELENLVALFRNKLVSALARRDVAGHA